MLPQQPQNETSSSSSTTTASNRLCLLRRRRQEELWQELHVETLTRLVSTEYAATLLILSLTMQLHWIGGQVFQCKYSSKDHHHHQYHRRRYHRHGPHPASVPAAAPCDPARWAQDVMMESHHYMIHQGMPLLIAAVRRAVLSSFSSSASSSSLQEEWTATTFVSQTHLETVLQHIDERLERGTDVGGGGSSFYTRNWIRWVLPDPTLLMRDDEEEEDDPPSSSEEEAGDDDDDPTTTTMERPLPTTEKVAMVEALWDLAESPAWEDAQAQTLQLVKQFVRDQGWGQIFRSSTTSAGTMTDPTTTTTATMATMIPVAKLMAPIKSACGLVALRPAASTQGLASTTATTTTTTTKKSKNSLPHKVQKLASVLELGDVSFHAQVLYS